MIHGLGGLVGLLGGPISCYTCKTLVKSIERRMNGGIIIWNFVYILSFAYIDAVIHFVMN